MGLLDGLNDFDMEMEYYEKIYSFIPLNLD